MPLMWAHAEYIKLVRSVHDGVVFDLVPEAAVRYRDSKQGLTKIDFWCHNHPIPEMDGGRTLRIVASDSFRLRWTSTEWRDQHDTFSSAVIRGLEFVDIPVSPGQRAPIRFTFFWTAGQNWQGRDYSVTVRESVSR
jgi:glucoamylase